MGGEEDGRQTAAAKKDAIYAPSLSPSVDAGPATLLLEVLTESILRRIMRVACAVGCVGIFSAFLSPRPYNGPALSVGVAATLLVFGFTYVPVRTHWLSLVYPWALALVGCVLGYLMGPRPEVALLIAGGIFVGSIVLQARRLALLLLATTVLLLLAALSHPAPPSPELTEAWMATGSGLAAVIAPAAIAGRMLVRALLRGLGERLALVDKITQERHVLQETVHTLENTRVQLTHAQKLELVSQMAGGIAHDMNNALTAIIGEASLLEKSAEEERERILEAGAYAAKLTRQLMVFGRRDTSQPRALDLGATLRSFLQPIRRIMPSDIVVKTDVTDELVVVVADPTQLLQVMLNLAGNAKDAMESGGSLTLQLARDPATGEAVLRVTDSGTGIPAEMLTAIFDPFFTTKPAGRGTGLGLANVKQIVESMNGTVTVTSRVGSGTTFQVRLPSTEAEVIPPDNILAATSLRTGTILVIDDDVRVRAVVYSALERQGHRVLEAATIAAACETAQTHHGKIDLLVTDVVMHGGGGAEAIRRIRAITPTVGVLVMSGYTNDETLRRGIAEGEFPFLAKPFTADELAAAVDHALAGASLNSALSSLADKKGPPRDDAKPQAPPDDGEPS